MLGIDVRGDAHQGTARLPASSRPPRAPDAGSPDSWDGRQRDVGTKVRAVRVTALGRAQDGAEALADVGLRRDDAVFVKRRLPVEGGDFAYLRHGHQCAEVTRGGLLKWFKFRGRRVIQLTDSIFCKIIQVDKFDFLQGMHP